MPIGRPMSPGSVAGVGRRGRRRTRRRTAVVAGGAAYAVGKSKDKQDQDQPAPDTQAKGDYVEELEKLAKLHEEGILTDAEFEAKKKEILG